MFDPEFLELMPDTCYLLATTTNVYGEGAPGGAIPIKCHIEYKVAQTNGSGDVVRTPEGTVYLGGHYPYVTTAYTLRLLVNSVFVDVKITSVDNNTDEGGWHHTVLHFGAF